MRSTFLIAWCVLSFVASAPFVFALAPSVEPVVGIREKRPSYHALINAKIVVSPDKTIDKGILIIRDGVIIDVSTEEKVPDGAKVHDLAGKTIYPGLIDAYATTNTAKPNGPGKHFSPLIVPQTRVVDSLQVDDKVQAKLRKQGITARLLAPDSGILRGTSALVATIDGGSSESILNASVAQHVWLGLPPGRGRSEYPNSPMGAVALARQTLLDADWYGRLTTTDRHPSLPFGPKGNDALANISQTLHARGLFILDARNDLNFGRAIDFSNEFSLNAAIRGSGLEYRILDYVRQAGRVVLLPVNFPKAPNVDSPEAAMDASLEDLMHWELAPENPGRLAQAGVTIGLTSYGLSNVEDFLPRIRTAVKHGLMPSDALRALTVNPAKLFGVDDRLGTLEAGKRADLVITDGDIFLDKTKITETWIAGNAFPMTAEKSIDIRGVWMVNLEKSPVGRKKFELAISGTESKPAAVVNFEVDKKSKSIKVDEMKLQDHQMIFRVPADSIAGEMSAQVSLTILAESFAVEKSDEWKAVGTARWSDGRTSTIRAARTKKKPAESGTPPSKSKDGDKSQADKNADDKNTAIRTRASPATKPMLRSKQRSPKCVFHFLDLVELLLHRSPNVYSYATRRSGRAAMPERSRPDRSLLNQVPFQRLPKVIWRSPKGWSSSMRAGCILLPA